MCESDLATPLLLRERPPAVDSANSPCNIERRLFSGRDSDPSDSETVMVKVNDDTHSGVSTIELPRSEQLSDYLVDSSAGEQEFSTDVVRLAREGDQCTLSALFCVLHKAGAGPPAPPQQLLQAPGTYKDSGTLPTPPPTTQPQP